jgi:hypothetical protein
VFLQPKDRAIRIDMPPPDMSGGQARLEMTNAGRLHVTPTSIALTGLDQHGQVVWTRPLRTWYLLAGETRHYTAPVPPEECRHTTTVAAEAFFAEDARLVLRERRALASSMACAAK